MEMTDGVPERTSRYVHEMVRVPAGKNFITGWVWKEVYSRGPPLVMPG